MKSYILCSTPRTGSTLLCSYLKSTELAGVPESYFRKQDLQRYAREWGLVNIFDFDQYLDAVIKAGMGKTSVFGCRIMWGTMEELLAHLSTLYPDTQSTDALLRKAFGNVRFLYLHRDNVVEQAVSRFRAEQSDIWHVKGPQKYNASPVEYDFNEIHQYVLEALNHNQQWIRWFQKDGLSFHQISYENLCENPKGTIADILEFLQIKPDTEIRIKTENRKMADEISLSFAKRYQHDAKEKL